MRRATALAAGASALGAGLAHALDVTGRLPGVHEAGAVRGAMNAPTTAAWLALAALAGALTSRSRRPLLPAVVGALGVAAVPELVGRLDSGAIAEPAALAGALLQAVLVLSIVAAAAAMALLWLVPLAGPVLVVPAWVVLPAWCPRITCGRRPHSSRLGRAPPRVG